MSFQVEKKVSELSGKISSEIDNTLSNSTEKMVSNTTPNISSICENQCQPLQTDYNSVAQKSVQHDATQPVTGNKSTITASTTSSNATDLLKASLIKFFSNKENIDRFLPIINRTSRVSLRLLDYFCVNYSRSTRVDYMLMDKYFDVHSSYKNQLKTFSKKMFDPFKRNTRITIRHENERFDTTLGQLCFFKWCLTHNVLDYVEANINAISEDMKKNTGKLLDEQQRNPSEKKKRSSRRRSAMNVTATRVPTAPGMDSVIVSFD